MFWYKVHPQCSWEESWDLYDKYWPCILFPWYSLIKEDSFIIHFFLFLCRKNVEVMSQVGATSKANIFLSHVFSIYTIAFHGLFHSIGLRWSQQLAFFFLMVVGGSLFTKKYPLSLLRCTEYVIVKGEQPNCVDLQTSGCCLDVEFSQLTLSQMQASIKVQVTLFWNFSAHLQIVKVVIAVLTHSMGCIAGIKNSNAYRDRRGHRHCWVGLICLLSLCFW